MTSQKWCSDLSDAGLSSTGDFDAMSGDSVELSVYVSPIVLLIPAR